MAILITGGFGYIGLNLMTRLVRSDKIFRYGQILLMTHTRENLTLPLPVGVTAVYGDLTDLTSLRRIFQTYDIRAVVHLAGLKSIREGERDPKRYQDVNVTGLQNLLSVIQQKVTFIFASNATVYQAYPNITQFNFDRRFKESQPLEPISTYGSTKRICEEMLRDWGRRTNHRLVILRIFNVIGIIEPDFPGNVTYPDRSVDSLLPQLDRAVQRYLTDGSTGFTIYGKTYPTWDDTPVRDFIAISDVCQAFLLALTTKLPSKYEIFNIGTGIGTSVNQMVSLYKQIRKVDFPVFFGVKRPGDLTVSIADPTRAEQILGFKAEETVEETLRTLYRKDP